MNGFTIYREYFDLVTLLSKKDQSELLLAICNYMFFDEEPVLNESQMKIFRNLKRPLDKSKKRSLSGSTTNSKNNQKENKKISNQKQNETKTKAHQDVDVNVIVNNNLEDNKRVIGGEEETFKDLYTLLEEGFVRTLSPIEYEVISTWEDNELTRYAITQAILNGASGINYISTILETYRKKNITTLEQAKRDTEIFKRNKERRNGKRNERLPEWANKNFEVKEASLEQQEEVRKKINEVIKRKN